MSLVVLDAGLASRLVDQGRPRTRSLGVPLGGAADRTSLALGNALVGNPPDSAALEVCLKGPILRAECDLACVVFGAPFSLSTFRQKLQAGTTFTLQTGEVLHIGTTPAGMRAYLCVRGAIGAAEIFGSRSALENIKVGEVLPCTTATIRRRFVPFLVGRTFLSVPPVANGGQECPSYAKQGDTCPPHVRVLPGPQADWFDEREFYQQDFTVTPALNRMGIRLHGRPLTMPARELVSEAVCPGTVQVTRDGQYIVLGVDGQTIGGYPKIAQVIQADLDRLGQVRPGETLRFAKVSQAEAMEAFRKQQLLLSEWTLRLRLSLDGF